MFILRKDGDTPHHKVTGEVLEKGVLSPTFFSFVLIKLARGLPNNRRASIQIMYVYGLLSYSRPATRKIAKCDQHHMNLFKVLRA